MGSNSQDVQPVRIEPQGLQGFLGVPRNAAGLVIFAHGSGSGRLSPRNNHVAAELRASGLGTLLLDLLTPDEELDRHNVFDIDLLASRLALARDWAAGNPATKALRVGYFGASTGAGAALVAASFAKSNIGAVVSRGGRPDLAGDTLDLVRAPTLLIVGSLDVPVIGLNEQALARLRCEKKLTIVPGASHLFEEPGTLDNVVEHARDWFLQHLTRTGEEHERHVQA